MYIIVILVLNINLKHLTLLLVFCDTLAPKMSKQLTPAEQVFQSCFSEPQLMSSLACMVIKVASKSTVKVLNKGKTYYEQVSTLFKRNQHKYTGLPFVLQIAKASKTVDVIYGPRHTFC